MANLEKTESKNSDKAVDEEVIASARKQSPTGADLLAEAFGTPGAEKSASKAVASNEAIKPHLDHNTISGAFSALGTVLTHPRECAESGLNQLLGLASQARAITRTVESVAALATPAGLSGLALTQVAVNKWENSDKSISVEKRATLQGDLAAEELGGYLELFEKQLNGAKKKSPENKFSAESILSKLELTCPSAGSTPKRLDLNSNIYENDQTEVSNTAAGATEKTREYTNDRGEKSKVTVAKDSVHVTAEKDGKTVTEAWQLNGLSSLSHKGETATLDTKQGKLEITSEQLRLLQQKGSQEITLNSGLKINRKNDQLTIFAPDGNPLQTLSADALVIEEDVAVIAGPDLASQASKMNKDTINVVVSTDGHALARLPGGIDIEVRKDHNAVIKTKDGDVLLVAQDGKVYILDDGKFVKLPCGKRGSIDVTDAGIVRIGKLEISENGIQFDGGRINLGQQAIDFHNAANAQRIIQLNCQLNATSPETGISVCTDRQKIAAFNGLIRTQVPTVCEEWTADLKEQALDSKFVHIDKDETRIKHDDGRGDTIISKDNSVHFDDGKGPSIDKDGGMRIDEQTRIDPRGNVTSGDWQASTGYSNAKESSTIANAASIDGAAAHVANSGNSAAMSVYGKASSGNITMSDINILSQSLMDVSALISQLAAMGRTDLVSQLENTRGMIVETISYALPRARAAEEQSRKTIGSDTNRLVA